MRLKQIHKKFFQHAILLIACILLIATLCGYHSKPSIDTWGTEPTGSAKYLDGTTVLVSLFIEDPSSNWSAEKREMVMAKMDLANDFLVAEGASYGKNVNLIYNIYEHPDLEYTVAYPDKIIDTDKSAYKLLDFITDYIDTQIPTQDIMEQYGVGSIAYMCFLDKSGVSYTFPYYEDDSDIYYYETCFMYLKCDGDYEPPAVYAHEMLHLFGARDLYATNELDGITKDFVQYIESQYPNEIMLTTYDENLNNVQEYVSNDLTDITAYFIGWLDTIPELETYPSIYYEYPASFGDVGDTSGDYSDYYAGDSDDADHPGGRWGSDSNSAGQQWGSGGSSASGWGSSSNSSNGQWGADSTSATPDIHTDPDGSLGFWDLIFRLFRLFFGN